MKAKESCMEELFGSTDVEILKIQRRWRWAYEAISPATWREETFYHDAFEEAATSFLWSWEFFGFPKCEYPLFSNPLQLENDELRFRLFVHFLFFAMRCRPVVSGMTLGVGQYPEWIDVVAFAKVILGTNYELKGGVAEFSTPEWALTQCFQLAHKIGKSALEEKVFKAVLLNLMATFDCDIRTVDAGPEIRLLVKRDRFKSDSYLDLQVGLYSERTGLDIPEYSLSDLLLTQKIPVLIGFYENNESEFGSLNQNPPYQLWVQSIFYNGHRLTKASQTVHTFTLKLDLTIVSQDGEATPAIQKGNHDLLVILASGRRIGIRELMELKKDQKISQDAAEKRIESLKKELKIIGKQDLLLIEKEGRRNILSINPSYRLVVDPILSESVNNRKMRRRREEIPTNRKRNAK